MTRTRDLPVFPMTAEPVRPGVPADVAQVRHEFDALGPTTGDRKSTRLNSSHVRISYAVFCLNAPATTAIYTLSLHDALPISEGAWFTFTPPEGALIISG